MIKDPTNPQYQLKLAEIYHGDKRSDDFVQHVEAIESGFNKESKEWAQIVSLGTSLVPDHALFSGGDSSGMASVNNEEHSLASDDIADDEIQELAEGDLDDNSLDFSLDEESELATDSDSDIDAGSLMDGEDE